MRVLIVDDDAAIRLLVRHVLKARGHDVVEAADGTAAEAALAAAPTDVMLMDVQLGGENGIDLADRLLRGRSHVPHLVFLTGTSYGEHVRRMEAMRPAGIVYKPFDPTTLHVMVEALSK